jgi:ADP-ribosylglycohydrolase
MKMINQSLHKNSLQRAATSLEGLSVGDAFGETFFVNPDTVEFLIEERAFASKTWRWTDDSLMAMSTVSVLREFGEINQDALAKSFAHRYDRTRGYGAAMHTLLWEIKCGEDWRERAPNLFSGQGSFGNGAAMRVAPLGAYFADDLEKVFDEAVKSSLVTHTHDEAVAGAIAVAVAAAYACQLRESSTTPTRAEFLDMILPHVPRSEVHDKIRIARDMNETATKRHAVAILGNGAKVTAQDTVPFSLWCAGTHLNNYEETLWLTVSGLGDRRYDLRDCRRHRCLSHRI